MVLLCDRRAEENLSLAPLLRRRHSWRGGGWCHRVGCVASPRSSSRLPQVRGHRGRWFRGRQDGCKRTSCSSTVTCRLPWPGVPR